MNTNCKRLMHVTFAIGVLALAMSASTPTAASIGGTQVTRVVAASWGSMTRGALALILGYATPVPVREVLPLGVVVDDGVPF